MSVKCQVTQLVSNGAQTWKQESVFGTQALNHYAKEIRQTVFFLFQVQDCIHSL